jgi:pteridine reductase
MIVHYHQSEQDAKSLKAKIGCELFRADFSATSIQDLHRRLQDEVGGIDILINNASHFLAADWKDIDEAMWDRELAVNLKIPFFLAQHFGKQMKAKGAGKILNIADIAAQHPYLKYLPYSIAKAGMVSFTQALARALAPEVQVNAIAPGTVLFPDDFSEPARAQITSRIPAGRTATVEEFLKTVDFLLQGVDYITGQTIVLDGGRTLAW